MVRFSAMAATVNVNGRVFDQEHAAISVFDHGFLYGEAVYETLRPDNGQPFLFDRHMRRLRNSAGMMALPVPVPDAEIGRRFLETMRAAGLGDEGQEAYIRLLVTRGVGDLSYDPAACPEPSFIVIVKMQIDPPRAVYEEGVSVVIASTVRNHPGTVNPLIKSNNLLNNALAGQEAVRRGAFEAAVRNFCGDPAECTPSDPVVVKEGGAPAAPPARRPCPRLYPAC